MDFSPSNNHNVYILGAGFSASAGLPLMGSFLNRMRDALESLSAEGRREERKAIESVLKYRLDAASAAYWATLDLENIEQLFSLASAAQHPVSESLPTAMAATIDFCRRNGPDGAVRVQPDNSDLSRSCRSDHSLPDPPLAADAPKIYQLLESCVSEGSFAAGVAGLLGMVNRDARPIGTNTFITFNYDTLIEDALDRLSVPWTYSSDPEDAEKDNGLESASKVPVIKLHGSVNWGFRKPTPNYTIPRITIFSSYDQVLDSGQPPLLLPPTWSKNLHAGLSSSWRLAVKRMANATRIVVIGFSMPETDLHFRYLVAAGLQNNAWLRNIIFVNPDPGIKDRAKHLLRASYVDQGLIRFLKMDASTFSSAMIRGFSQFQSTDDCEGEIDFGRTSEACLSFWCHKLQNR